MVYPRLKDLRVDRDLYQRDVAAALGIPTRTLSHYENGTRVVPPWILVALADFYGTSVDYLLGRTDQPKPYPKGRTIRIDE